MGMEKLFDIVCRVGELRPDCVVLVCTVRALKHHGGMPDSSSDRARGMAAIVLGSQNLKRHLDIVGAFGVPCVVAVNRRPEDTDEEVELVRRLALEYGAGAAEVNDAFARGGDGATGLAEAVVEACDQENDFHFLYEPSDPLIAKIKTIATRVYGAADVYVYAEAERKLQQFTEDGLGKLPICMAKTHLSLSADPALLGAPEGFTLPVRDVRAYTGAGWIVPLCGDITQMPGLARESAAVQVDITDTGRTVGLF
jgi:formate--tetrahydrofolate ligase